MTQVLLSTLTEGDTFRDRAGRVQTVRKVRVGDNPFKYGVKKVAVYVESGQHVRTAVDYRVWKV